MKNKQIKEFFTKVAQDESFKAEVLKLKKGMEAKKPNEQDVQKFVKEKLLPKAKKLGYDFSEQDLADFGNSQEMANLTELSPEELENVSGGFGPIAIGVVSALGAFLTFVGGLFANRELGPGVDAAVKKAVVQAAEEKSDSDEEYNSESEEEEDEKKAVVAPAAVEDEKKEDEKEAAGAPAAGEPEAKENAGVGQAEEEGVPAAGEPEAKEKADVGQVKAVVAPTAEEKSDSDEEEAGAPAAVNADGAPKDDEQIANQVKEMMQNYFEGVSKLDKQIMTKFKEAKSYRGYIYSMDRWTDLLDSYAEWYDDNVKMGLLLENTQKMTANYDEMAAKYQEMVANRQVKPEKARELLAECQKILREYEEVPSKFEEMVTKCKKMITKHENISKRIEELSKKYENAPEENENILDFCSKMLAQCEVAAKHEQTNIQKAKEISDKYQKHSVNYQRVIEGNYEYLAEESGSFWLEAQKMWQFARLAWLSLTDTLKYTIIDLEQEKIIWDLSNVLRSSLDECIQTQTQLLEAIKGLFEEQQGFVTRTLDQFNAMDIENVFFKEKMGRKLDRIGVNKAIVDKQLEGAKAMQKRIMEEYRLAEKRSQTTQEILKGYKEAAEEIKAHINEAIIRIEKQELPRVELEIQKFQQQESGQE